MKKCSLRARLTLLSALVTAGVAATLTAVFLFGADRIFVRELPQQLIITQKASLADVGDPDAVPRDAQGEFSFTSEAATTTDAAYTVQVTLAKAGRRFSLLGVAGLLLVTAAGAGVTWLMAGRALGPVRELSRAIEEAGSGDLSRRVEVRGGDEIARLARSFNDMMDKVSASFERQKRFSASAAHELKTPLATIQVGLEVLELDERPSPARMEKALSVAKVNTERMIRLVEDLFRLSSDADCAMTEEVPVAGLLDEILAELSPQIEAGKLSASARADGDVNLRGNRTMLYRALFNLAENAVKYNRPGGSVALSAAKEGGEVLLCISDTGIGIPPAELAHIFEPFYRVDRSRSRAMGGSGLGLPLVRDIVEKHGGTVTAESAVDKGTIFTLRFPAPAEKSDKFRPSS